MKTDLCPLRAKHEFVSFGLTLVSLVVVTAFAGCQKTETRVQGKSVDMSSVEQQHEKAVDPADAIAANGLDLTYATDIFFAAVVVHPQRILESDVIDPQDFQVLFEEQGSQLGTPLLKSQRATFYLPRNSGGEEMSPVVFLELQEPVELEGVLRELDEELEKETIDERTLFVSEELKLAAIHLNDETILAGDPRLVKEFARGRQQRRGRLAELMAELDLDADAVGVMNISGLPAMAGMAARMMFGGADGNLPNSAFMKLDLEESQFVHLGFDAATTDDAAAIKLKLQSVLSISNLAGSPQAPPSVDQMASVEQQTLAAFGNELMSKMLIDVSGNRVTIVFNRPRQTKQAFSAMAKLAMEAKSLMEREEKLQKVSEAVLAYQEKHGTLPFAVSHFESNLPEAGSEANSEDDAEVDSLGSEPSQLSWRVRILPELGLNELYEQFHLDEPWDSEHNLTLIEQIPEVFKLDDGEEITSTWTRYDVQLVDGESMQVKSIADVTDPLKSTILLVESTTHENFHWTQPKRDFVQIEGDEVTSESMDSFGRRDEQFVMASYFDGTTKRLPRTLDPKTWKSQFTPQGGEKNNDKKSFGSSFGIGNMGFGF